MESAERHQVPRESAKKGNKASSTDKKNAIQCQAQGTEAVPSGLEVRRIRGDLIEVYKILHGLDHLEATKFFSLSTTSTRGHSLKLFKKSMWKGLQLRKYFFSQRVIHNWNKLPAHIVNAKNVNEFKKFFDQYMTEKGYGVLKGLSL